MDPNEESEMFELEDSMTEDKQVSFVNLLKKFPALLEKSQVPALKIAKTKAAEQFILQWGCLQGENLTEKTLMKKLNNMKARIKVKADANRTGNKKIILKKWEQLFLEIIKADINPTFSKIPGAVSTIPPARMKSRGGSELEPFAHSLFHGTHSPNSLATTTTPSVNKIPAPPTANKRKKEAQDYMKDQETDETRELSNQQLQRLVWLEQLRLLRLKRNKLENQDGGGEKSEQVYTIVQESRLLVVSSQEIGGQDGNEDSLD